MNVTSPIVISLGRAQREQVDQLRSGAGQILEDIEEVMKLVRLSAGKEGEKRVFLPVVAVYSPL
jgi:hypothetical protein